MVPFSTISSIIKPRSIPQFRNILTLSMPPNPSIPLQATLTTMEALVEDGTYGNYRDFLLSKLLAMEELDLDYSKVGALSPKMQGQIVLVRGRMQVTRLMGKKLVFLNTALSIQCMSQRRQQMRLLLVKRCAFCLFLVSGISDRCKWPPHYPCRVRNASNTRYFASFIYPQHSHRPKR